jgi:ribonuclease P protein component
MLPKKHRFQSPKEFYNIRKDGKFYKSPFFTVIFKKNIDNEAKFAFIVSKKESKSSVKRNRMKRIFKSLVLEDVTLFKGDFLFFPKSKTLNISRNLLKKEIEKFIEYLKEYNK